SGKEQSIRIEASSGLSQADIERMQKEAEMHSDEDRKKKELVEAKNLAEQLIYTAEKSLTDAGDKVPAEGKTSVQGKIDALKKEKDGGTLEAIKTASNELSTEMQKIGQAMQQNAETNAPPEKGSPDNGVKDVEFEE